MVSKRRAIAPPAVTDQRGGSQQFAYLPRLLRKIGICHEKKQNPSELDVWLKYLWFHNSRTEDFD